MRYASSEKQVRKFCFISRVRVNGFAGNVSEERHYDWRVADRIDEGQVKRKAQLLSGLSVTDN